MIQDLNLIRAFLHIYQERSITRSAEKLHLSKAAITKRLVQLETQMGHLLFRRSTRKLTPTPEADRLYQSATKLMESVRDFESSITDQGRMEGTVSVTCTSSMSQKFLSKVLLDFQKKNPKIQINIVVTDSFLDLIENNIDLALRIGNIPSSNLYGKKLAVNHISICASPTYIESKGRPKSSADLRKHNLVYLDVHEDLEFTRSNVTLKSVTQHQSITSNDAQIVNQMGLSGSAIIVRSHWDVKDFIEKKKLIPLLANDPLEANGDIWLLASAGRMQTKRVRALFDFIAAESLKYLE